MPEDVIIGLKTLQLLGEVSPNSELPRPEGYVFTPEQVEFLHGLDSEALQKRYNKGEILLNIVLNAYLTMLKNSEEDRDEQEEERLLKIAGNLKEQIEVISSIILDKE